MYTFPAQNNLKQTFWKKIISTLDIIQQGCNFVCQPRGTGDEYLLWY